MLTISLCMIVKNEESVLARCLESIKDAVDEIIIVDTGSTDNTKEIALRYTGKLYDFEWIDDFSAARNEAFSKATMDYQMWLDADDVFPEESLNKLLELKKTLDPGVDIVTMKYITHFDEQDRPVLASTRERLTKREKGYLWTDPVHECIPLIGNIFYSDMEVHHRKQKKEGVSHRNLNIYMNLEKSGKPLSPRQQYYYARELKDHGLWINSAYYFEKFLESKQGWKEDNIAACYNLSLCYNILGDTQKILPILLKSFEYDAPRAENCCEIGYYYKRAGRYDTSLKWFRLAAALDDQTTAGFILSDYHGYIPNIECCVCCCHLKDFAGAEKFNERAASFKPDSPAVKSNRAFLSAMK
ncbi:MAG: glycosyltransferase family 2 protein [Defluviitaleaceae bacterium]|nr:glycosyltransferase family 2 protein [Defluviitaleaceae bacterium]